MEVNSNNITLYNWAYGNGDKCLKKSDELKSVFISMDKALKYLHEENCIVDSFNPFDIQLVNGDINKIFYSRFSTIQNPFNREKLIKDNILKLSCLEIGMFTNTLSSLEFDFLYNNYDSFAENMPSELTPYYRGIILRGSLVYLCEFLEEKQKRDLENLQKEFGSDADKEVYDNRRKSDLTNKEINDDIYSKKLLSMKKGKYNDYGMINFILIFTIVLVVLIVLSILTLVFV